MEVKCGHFNKKITYSGTYTGRSVSSIRSCSFVAESGVLAQKLCRYWSMCQQSCQEFILEYFSLEKVCNT